MIEVKMFEVRDRMTFIPVLAIQLSGADDPLLWRAGFATDFPYVVMLPVNEGNGGAKFRYDPHGWGSRTLVQAHLYIQNRWNDLKSGDVVDVEYVLGESKFPKKSEVSR